MTIAFISTIRSSWGGSEELWAACAKEALKTDSVIISAFDCGELSDKTNALLKEGAKLDLRIGVISENLPKWRKLQKKIKRVYSKTIGNPFKNLFKYNPDIVLYIGTAYSIGNDHKLIKLIERTKASFFINIQLNFEDKNYKLSPKQKK